jgi:hypothetical protein
MSPSERLLHSQLAKMNSVVTFCAQILDDRRADADIGEEAHVRSLGSDYLLARQPRGVLKGLGDVFALQIRILPQHLFG